MTGLQKNAESGSDASASAAKKAPSGSLARAIVLLDEISRHGPLRFAQIQDRLSLPKATLHRTLAELQNERLIRFDDRSLTYQAGFRMLEIANQIWSRSDLRALARDQLEQLCELSCETVQLSVQADTQAVSLDSVESDNNIRMSTGIGSSIPLYCTGAGKALLSLCTAAQQRDIINRISFSAFTPNTITDKAHLQRELNHIRAQGYAEDNEEHFAGIRSVAAPVITSDGQPLAVVSISGPTFRVSEQDTHNWRDWLLDATGNISNRVAPTATGIC